LKSSNPILRILDYLEEGFCVVLLVIMTVLNFANVLSRYVLHSSIAFTDELTVMAFVWVSMIGAAVAYKRASHMSMSFVQDQFSKKNQAWFALFSMICSVVFLAILVFYGVLLVKKQIMLGYKTPSLRLPGAFQSASIPVGGAFMLIRSIQLGLTQFNEFRKGDEKK
jgi:TRAP-type C4-dicarboxylate transport system permease small subunit